MSRLLVDTPDLVGWASGIALVLGILLLPPLALLRALARRHSATIRYRLASASLVTLVALFPLTVWVAASALPPRLAGLIAIPPLSARVTDLRHEAVGIFPLVVGLWAAGVLIGLARLGIGAVRLRQIIARAPAARRLAPEFQSLALRVGLWPAPALVESTEVSGPFVIGWGRGTVVLPAGFTTLLSPEEREAVLLHELMHLVRHDFAWNAAQQLLATLFWFHPGFWVVGAQVRRVREECCDDAVVATAGRPVILARALVHLEEIRVVESGLVLAGTGGALATRVRRLLSPPASNGSPRPLALTFGSFALAGSLTGAGWGGRWAADLTTHGTPIVRILASDPAGPFTVEMAGGVIRGMTVNGAVVPRDRLRQSGHRLELLDAGGTTQLDLQIESPGAIHWKPRPFPTP